MLVCDDKFMQAYGAVKTELQQADNLDRKVPIFVSTVDADSVCALRILTSVLQSEGIHYSVYPVSGWQEVQERVKSELLDKEDLTNIFFINCGGTEDLVELLGLNNENHRVLVIDSHRPIHTANAAVDNGQVMVLMDGKDEAPPDDLGEDLSSDSDSSDEESDEEEGDENEPPRQQQRTAESDATARAAKQREKRRMREDRQRRRIQYYDRGAWRGTPAACITYELTRQLQKEDNRALWLSIMGVTDQLVHQLINGQEYEKLYHLMEQQVNALGNGDMKDSVDIEDGGTVRIPLNRRIGPLQDYRFTLLKHWTLHDSMLYSPYVATRLQTWREKGRRNLELLLAKMGCSLVQCRQHYGHMKHSIKDSLSSKLENYAPTYNLPDLQFSSFQMEMGYKRAFSASDAVYGVTALLEAHALEEEGSKESFWKAYGALGDNAMAELYKGIELAKKVQRTIIDDGGSVMARRAVLSMSAFRVVNLSDGEVSDRALLSQPLALLRLAMFIQDAYRVMQNKVKPVIVVAPEGQDHMCLVVGYTGRPKLADVNGNRFGNAFAHAQEATKCDMSADYFDQYTVKVAKSDIYRFIAAVDNGHHMKD
mmetsp:Transcript_28012/g.72073  ORF Transcript_28012/g.72073 Transcript_28012/m.72073 type:complete len:595 (+) Transcript_28012:73-1857(+)|eukprot:jgi/Tetstr1/444918/TSEL_032736.t1